MQVLVAKSEKGLSMLIPSIHEVYSAVIPAVNASENASAVVVALVPGGPFFVANNGAGIPFEEEERESLKNVASNSKPRRVS